MAITTFSRCSAVRSAAKQGLCPARVSSRRSTTLRCRAKDPREDTQDVTPQLAEDALGWIGKAAVPQTPSGSGPLDYALKPSDVKHDFKEAGAVLKGEANAKSDAVKQSARNTADVTKSAVGSAVDAAKHGLDEVKEAIASVTEGPGGSGGAGRLEEGKGH